MIIYKQIIKDTDLVNIASFNELRFNFWKDDNKKYLEKEIEADTRLKISIMELLPDFDNLVTLYEIKWLKSRNDFNLLERETVTNEFKKRINVDDSYHADGSKWTISGSDSSGYTITIDIIPEKSAKYPTVSEPKKASSFVFKIDKYGEIKPGDPLTDAYLQNPFKMNDKKTDFAKAKSLKSKSY